MHGAETSWNESCASSRPDADDLRSEHDPPASRTRQSFRAAAVKALPLAETAAGPYVKLTRRDRGGPQLSVVAPVYAVFNIDNEKSELPASTELRELPPLRAQQAGSGGRWSARRLTCR